MFGRILLIALLGLVFWGVVARASSGAGTEGTYVVKPGDTLWTIADRSYDGDVRAAIWRLQERNGIRGSTIRVGQRLVMPAG